MKKIIFAALAATGLFLAGCSTTAPCIATGNAIGSKTGKVSGMRIMGIPIPFNQDLGSVAAAKSAGITKISTVDVEVANYVVFQTISTIVTGE